MLNKVKQKKHKKNPKLLESDKEKLVAEVKTKEKRKPSVARTLKVGKKEL